MNMKKIKFPDEELALLGDIALINKSDAIAIMFDKGDFDIYHTEPSISAPTHFNFPQRKNMKRADRRKRTFHKQEQREKKYRDLGYHIEHFSASERGKMREGVGMFPETQHGYSMNNRNSCKGGMCGYRKEVKPIASIDAISMMAHERWLDEQEAIAEYEEAERLFMMDEMEALNREIRYLDVRINEERENMLRWLNLAHESDKTLDSLWGKKMDLIERANKIQEELSK